MSDVVLVRHGWTAWEQTSGRDWPGAMLDLAPLSPAGVARMASTADRLSEAGITAVISSPTTRALQSAHIVAVALEVPLHVEVNLHEWLCRQDGKWSGKTEFGTALDDLLAGRPAEAGESLAGVRDRARAVIEAYRGRGPIAVITHNVVIYALTGTDVPPGGIVRWSARRNVVPERTLREPPSVDTAAPLRYQLLGHVDVPALEAELTALVHRHPALRRQILRREQAFVEIPQPDGEVACAIVDDEAGLSHLAQQKLDPFGWPPLRAVLLPGDPALLCLTTLEECTGVLENDRIFGANSGEKWIGGSCRIRRVNFAAR
jgi:uncharacterized phosphatase